MHHPASFVIALLGGVFAILVAVPISMWVVWQWQQKQSSGE